MNLEQDEPDHPTPSPCVSALAAALDQEVDRHSNNALLATFGALAPEKGV